MNLSEITAVVPTRGDVDLAPILATLTGYREVIVWVSQDGCWGRYLAMKAARTELVYTQDDDLIFTAHRQLLDLHSPGRITANMPSPWYEGAGYDVEQSVQVGAGSVMHREAHVAAVASYLACWPDDDDFRVYCDDVVGILTPSLRVDLGYQVLDYASASNRIWTQPGARQRRNMVAGRALDLRANGC